MPRRGGLIGLIGQGVGMAAEYHEHRKEKKLSRENSRQDDSVQASSSSTPTGPGYQNQLPPSYEAASSSSSSRQIASGNPATDDKKAALHQYDDDSDSDGTSSEDYEDDDELWAIDDSLTRDQEANHIPSYEESEAAYNADMLSTEVLTKNRAALAATPSFQRTPLPCPVIIPQRRPGAKVRGFVHAYAPLLGECSGISQDTFITFIKNFHKSSQASPIFPAIRVAAAIAGFAPSVIAMAVTTAVQFAAGTAQELQTRSRTNNFLDKMNEELFKPAGLYAMIVKYQSDADVAASGNGLLAKLGVGADKIDLSTNQSIAKYTRTESAGTMADRMKQLRVASATTRGSARMPEAAPLIFPEVDRAVELEGEEGFKAKAKDVTGFLGDYMDRRAQMKHAQNDPNSALALPEEQRAFRSKLADPNHPMFNGGLIGLVSGGKATPFLNSRRGDKRQYRDERKMLRYERRLQSGRGLSGVKERRYGDILDRQNQYYQKQTTAHEERPDMQRGAGSYGSAGSGSYYGQGQRRQRKGGVIGTVKKVMAEGVLYLMIVNMPSEEELAEARETLARAKAEQ